MKISAPPCTPTTHTTTTTHRHKHTHTHKSITTNYKRGSLRTSMLRVQVWFDPDRTYRACRMNNSDVFGSCVLNGRLAIFAPFGTKSHFFGPFQSWLASKKLLALFENNLAFFKKTKPNAPKIQFLLSFFFWKFSGGPYPLYHLEFLWCLVLLM